MSICAGLCNNTSFIFKAFCQPSEVLVLFQHHRGESSLQLFILSFVYLISVPNAFLSFNFQNLDLFKFAQSFHAMLTSQPFLYFAQALVSGLIPNFRPFRLDVQQTAHNCSGTQNLFCIFEVKAFYSYWKEKLESILPLLASFSIATEVVLFLSLPLCS